MVVGRCERCQRSARPTQPPSSGQGARPTRRALFAAAIPRRPTGARAKRPSIRLRGPRPVPRPRAASYVSTQPEEKERGLAWSGSSCSEPPGSLVVASASPFAGGWGGRWTMPRAFICLGGAPMCSLSPANPPRAQSGARRGPGVGAVQITQPRQRWSPCR